MVHDHILQRGAAFRERGAALRVLINAEKSVYARVAAEAALQDRLERDESMVDPRRAEGTLSEI
jgi:hypothetical protein